VLTGCGSAGRGLRCLPREAPQSVSSELGRVCSLLEAKGDASSRVCSLTAMWHCCREEL
jgi:hypothetical protein